MGVWNGIDEWMDGCFMKEQKQKQKQTNKHAIKKKRPTDRPHANPAIRNPSETAIDSK